MTILSISEYQEYMSRYVVDGEGTYGLVYGTTPYTERDIIPSGWTGKYSPYNGLPEIVPAGDLPISTDKGRFMPRSCQIADVTQEMINEVLYLDNVEFKEDTPSSKSTFTGYSVDGRSSIFFRNQLMVQSVPAG